MEHINNTRPFERLEDDEFDDLLDADIEDCDMMHKLLFEAAQRGYEGDGVESLLDRFLRAGIDDLSRKYNEAFSLFFEGIAIDCFVNDAIDYLGTLGRHGRSGKQEIQKADTLEGQPGYRSADMPRTLFPVAEYYADHVLDGTTLSRNGGWWSAVLLIRDPKTSQPFLSLYRWELVEGVWKNRKSFVIRDQAAVDKVVSALNEFKSKLPGK